MGKVLMDTWPLLLGIMLFMVGNGMQGTLLGVRGGLEGFPTFEMSIVMSAYFVGFLGGSRMTPGLIRRVGHVRVFAALGSLISAVLVLYPVVAHPIAWTVLRAIIGFCFSGVYVTAESWLNNATTNETRGQALSAYIIVQMVGIVAAQGLITLGDPGGYVLFIVPSVLVSLAFAPILLSVTPAPVFETTKRMSLAELYAISPLGCVGMFILGGMFAALFGMSAVYGAEAQLSVREISAFVASIYLGGMVAQYPIGWLSDRIDRRLLVAGVAALCAAMALAEFFLGSGGVALLVVGFVIGGTTNPLYALLLAHTNDFLESDDMAAASGGLVFINGVGAIAGPLVVGWFMGVAGPPGFFLYLFGLGALLAGYATWRMTRRPTAEETGQYVTVVPTVSPVAVELAQEAAWQSDDTGEDGGSHETKIAL
ncbi:MAG: MFS transporter [Alphaproteobacteria bacterium]|nr:MAG: MFS transporter [Alphaproteobacteria bacterium]